MRNKPNVVALKVGMEPDGYQEWLVQDAEEKARRNEEGGKGGRGGGGEGWGEGASSGCSARCCSASCC